KFGGSSVVNDLFVWEGSCVKGGPGIRREGDGGPGSSCRRKRCAYGVWRQAAAAGRRSAQTARAAGRLSGPHPLARQDAARGGARDIAAAGRTVGVGTTVAAPESEQLASAFAEREGEVLEMVAGGAAHREIADRLFLAPHPVKDHTSALFRKMKAGNRAEAIL